MYLHSNPPPPDGISGVTGPRGHRKKVYKFQLNQLFILIFFANAVTRANGLLKAPRR
jgi:hypothetical protein